MAKTSDIPRAPLLSASPVITDCLQPYTANVVAAIAAYWQRGFLVKIKPYRTEQDYESGLTFIVCNYCEARGGLGFEQPNHPLTCPEHPSKSQPGTRRRYTGVLKSMTYTVYGEIMPDGSIVMP